MLYLPRKIQSHFDINLADWLAGGPSPNGWTRSGPAHSHCSAKIVGYHVECLDVDEVLAKNTAEVTKWHIEFLRRYANNPAFDWRNTQYYHEYLRTRFNDLHAYKVANRFLMLFEDIKNGKVRYSICVADVQKMMLGFRYFRFDGCHRASCAKVLGIDRLRCFVFTASTFHS